MKTKVLISSDCGIESMPLGSRVGILPDEISFSKVEVYKYAKEMDFRSFNLRLKYDSNANPLVKGCSEETLRDVLENLEFEGYERFYFILSNQKLNYYKPLIEKIIKENKSLQAFYYTVKTEGYPIIYMAMEAQKMFDNNKTIPDVERMINFVDGNNTTYIYSPLEDKIPKIEKYSVDDEAFEIKGNGSILYMLKRNDSAMIRLKEKNKSISPYIDVLLLEMDGRKVIPFVMYTNKYSEYTKAILKELGKSFVDSEVLSLEMPPYMVLKYGKYSIAMGYVVKYDKEA